MLTGNPDARRTPMVGERYPVKVRGKRIFRSEEAADIRGVINRGVRSPADENHRVSKFA